MSTESIPTIYWLPPEIRDNMFDFLTFESKRDLRLIDHRIKNEIERRPEILFNVKLNDQTINCVENVTFPRIDTLQAYKFTKFINSANIPTIQTVVFGGEISTIGLGHLLKLCKEKSVQNLKFRHSFIPEVDNLQDKFQVYVLADVKLMEIKLGMHEDLTKDRTGSSISDSADERSQSLKLFNFLKNRLTFPSLEKIHIEIDLNLNNFPPMTSCYAQHVFSRVYNYVNGQRQIKSLGLNMKATEGHCRVNIDLISLDCFDLEELQLKLDLTSFSVHGTIDHKFGCKKLKKLKIEDCTESKLLNSIIDANSSTLEIISVESDNSPTFCPNLDNCTNLKELALRSLHTSKFGIEKPMPPEFTLHQTLQRLSLEFPLGRENEFRVIQNILARMKGGVQELTFKPLRYLGMDKLKWILSIPNLKKLILTQIDSGSAKFMARRCEKQIPGKICSCSVIPIPLDGNIMGKKSDLCIKL